MIFSVLRALIWGQGNPGYVTMKKTLIILGLTALSAVLAVVTLFVVAFSGAAPIADGRVLSGGVRIVKDGFVSVALIPVGEGAYALVDCGNDPNAKAIKAELQRQQLKTDAVKSILITHGHADHVGGCKAFPGVPILGLPTETPLLTGAGGVRSPLSKLIAHRDTGVRVTMPLRDGETFAVGALQVTVYAIPGHTDGSAAYLAAGVLFLGDSADSSKSGKLLAAKWLFSNDQAENRQSLTSLYQRLKPQTSNILWLEFAHSGPLPTLAPLANFTGITQGS